MSAQHTSTLTVFSGNRDTKRYPDANKYALTLPHHVPRVRQVMLSAIEFSSVQRNIESPGVPLPFGEGVALSGAQYCEEPGQINFNNEIILVQGDTRSKIDLPPGHRWRTMIHNGVLFAPEYEPHGIKMRYDGQEVDLTPAQEELATMYVPIAFAPPAS